MKIAVLLLALALAGCSKPKLAEPIAEDPKFSGEPLHPCFPSAFDPTTMICDGGAKPPIAKIIEYTTHAPDKQTTKYAEIPVDLSKCDMVKIEPVLYSSDIGAMVLGTKGLFHVYCWVKVKP